MRTIGVLPVVGPGRIFLIVSPTSFKYRASRSK